MGKRRSEHRRLVSLLFDMRRRDHKELYEALQEGYNVTEYARQLLMKQLGIQSGSGVNPVELDPKPETPTIPPVKKDTPKPEKPVSLLPPSKEEPAKAKTEGDADQQQDLLDITNLGF